MESRTRDTNLSEREAEATEKETLEDLEESFGSSEEEVDNVPSPDGAFDEEDELESADPN